MAVQKDKFQDFSETLDNLRNILYSLDVASIDRAADDFKKKSKEKINTKQADKKGNKPKKEV
ncbi:MAG: hypothetical protein LBR70_01775 [Lactobacillaceae bacterium]|jgi:hypothetical protein|nr:hypothetical protein [Lactobacillaceae bacterium]